MIRFRNIMSVAALLVGAAIMAMPTQARASFEILVFVNGTPTAVTGPLGNTATNGSTSTDFFSMGTVGSNFTVNLTSLDVGYPGSAQAATESNTTNGSFSVTGTLATATTLTIVISENGWTAPATLPLSLSSSAGGSLGSAGGAFSASATNQGFVDNTNALPGLNPGGTSTPQATASASVSGTGTSPLVYSPSPATSLAPGGAPFALTEVFSYTFPAGTYAVGDGFNVSGSVSVAAVPAPNGFVLAFTGLPILAVGAWLRRRRLAA